MRDLFIALLDENNTARNHKLLVTLLYTYCPRAAYWWMNGVEPILPADPVWLALRDMAAGYTLQDALIHRSLDTTLNEARRYVREVGRFRSGHPGLKSFTDALAPEVSAFFEAHYDSASFRKRFELKKRMRPFGSWDGFYDYVRTYAFLFEDWAYDMGFKPATTQVERLTLSVRLARSPQLPPVHWPAWGWRAEGPLENVAAFAFEGQQDPIRFTLLANADRVGNKWDGKPQLYSLHPETGAAKVFDESSLFSTKKGEDDDPADDGPVAIETISHHVDSYYHGTAKQGPYPPLAAYTRPSRCQSCGFRRMCYDDSGKLEYDAAMQEGAN